MSRTPIDVTAEQIEGAVRVAASRWRGERLDHDTVVGIEDDVRRSVAALAPGLPFFVMATPNPRDGRMPLRAWFPRWQHDCDRCEFLGCTGRVGAEESTDLYACGQGGSLPTYIARHSDEPSDYVSGAWLAPYDPEIREAERRHQRHSTGGRR